MRIRHLLIGGVLLGSAALAQDAPAYDGRWGGTFVTPNGHEFTVELVLDGAGGTWQVFPRSKEALLNRCTARAHSVTVHDRSATELKFSFDASRSLQGCQDGHAVVRLVDSGHLEGHFADGRALKLSRQ